MANKKYRDSLKRELIAAYGGRCACCGEDRLEFLTIDHIHGGGNRERKELKKRGPAFQAHLRRLGFPKDKYRLLCYNCNCSKAYAGYCPHEREAVAGISVAC